MRFLNPTAFLALLLALPIIALYFLRLRRREITVASILLWETVLTDRHANRPWQKLRRNWLLAIQILALLALVLALARPAFPIPLALHGQIIVLLDTSASMQATTEAGKTRFDVALRALRELAGTLEGGDEVTLVAVGPTPRLLLRGVDAPTLRQTLPNLRPTDGGADWEAAAALISGMVTADEITTLLITDTAIDQSLPTLPGNLRLITVADEQPNAGIVAFGLRRTSQGPTAFVRLLNSGPNTRRTLSLYADDVLVERRSVELPTQAEASFIFPELPAFTWAEVRLDGADALALDDRAWLALSGAGSGHVLLVTDGNRFLDQALGALPDLTVERANDLQPLQTTDQPYNLLVSDGPLTNTLPTINSWFINPGMGSPCGEPGAVFTPTTVTRGEWSHPLLQYVDWSEVHVARARGYVPPADATLLLENTRGPLLWVVERPGQRVACLAFDLHDSDLPLRLAFPVLTSNLVTWLLPETSTEPLHPYPSGRTWLPPLPPNTTEVNVILPDGETLTVPPGAPVNATRAGLYRIDAESADGTITRFAALSLLDERESNLHPRPLTVGETTLTPTANTEPGWREIRNWATAIALALILLEAVMWWRPTFLHQGALPSCRPLLERLRLRPIPLILRALLVATVILALLGIRWARPTRDLATAFLLDRSASTRASWEKATTFVAEALAQKAPDDRAAIVVFGARAWVERGLSTAPEMDSVATYPHAEATDIEAAVRMGAALLPEGVPGRLVLLTDGLETRGRAIAALHDADLRDIDLQVVELGDQRAGPEIWLEDLRLPTTVYPGDHVPVGVSIGSDHAERVLITWQAGESSGHEEINVLAGHNNVILTVPAEKAGFIPLNLCLVTGADTYAQNNCTTGWLHIEGAPRLLIVGADAERSALVEAFQQTGLEIQGTEPNALPLTIQGFADYAGVILVNTSAHEIPAQALESLQIFVRDLGGGLITVGGPESYGVGGWLETPLEETLPVRMLVQDPRRFPPLAMAVVIDKSGSMSAAEGGPGSTGIPKIRLAAEAAARVAEALNDTDTLAVIAYDDRAAVTLGPVPMSQRESLITAVLRLQAGGGGIYVRESLDHAASLLRQVEQAPGQQRHLLLLADGSDAEHQEGVISQVASLRAEGITVSVVAIGNGQDVAFLAEVAETGDGRFYLTERASDLPAIFAEETARAKRSYIIEETFYPEPVSTWAPLADMAATPPLHGYVATTPKGSAQVVWQTAQGDPLLAAWQYGLGRAVAWTSDTTGRWAAGWVTWEDFARFWGSVVRWVLPPPSDEGLTIQVTAEAEQAEVTVDVTTPEGGYVNDLDLYLQISRPGVEETSQERRLQQTAPGRYESNFAAPESGVYLLRIHGDRNLTSGWARSYPTEFRPNDTEAAVARLISQTALEPVEEPGAVFIHNLRGRRTGQPLTPWLVLIAALLWPVDIAWRRLRPSRADLEHLAQGMRTKIKDLSPSWRPTPTEAPTSLASRLRRRQTKKPTPPPAESPLEAPAQDELPADQTAPASSKRRTEPRGGTESLAARLKKHLEEEP